MISTASRLGAVVFCFGLLGSTTSYAASTASSGDRAHVLFNIGDPRILEASGMAASTIHHGVVWIANDSGNGPYLYAINSRGATKATIVLNGAVNVDWEALASGADAKGDPVLYIGDIGDNHSRRPFIRVYQISEPATLQDGAARWVKYDFTYPDGPHDAETLLADPIRHRLYVVTKAIDGAAIYEAPARLRPGQSYQLHKIADAPAVITDGAFSPDGSQLVLRTYVSADFYSAADGAAQARIALPLEPQGETIAYARDGASLLVGSEGKGSAVWYVPLPVIGASGSGQPTPTSQESAPAQLPGRAVLVLVGISALVVLLVATTVAVVRRRRQSASVSTT